MFDQIIILGGDGMRWAKSKRTSSRAGGNKLAAGCARILKKAGYIHGADLIQIFHDDTIAKAALTGNVGLWIICVSAA